MVEVFKTNVTDTHDARRVIETIAATFQSYKSNFDLEDCDRILRVENSQGAVEASAVVQLIASCGFLAQILPDDLPQLLSVEASG